MTHGIADLKPGMLIELDGLPHLVIKAQHAKLGRGGAMLRTTLRNLVTQAQFERTFKGDEKFLPANLARRKAQVLFQDEGAFIFMDSENFEQFNLPKATLSENKNFLKEGELVEIFYFKERPLSVNLPIKMKFRVIEAEPNVKGNSATTPTKNARIETGYQLKVPIFIKVGDTIIIDTRDGSYVERAGG